MTKHFLNLMIAAEVQWGGMSGFGKTK